jgi:hypothetical protein
MRFYNQLHRFYCGMDLHTRTLSLCVLDGGGAIVLEATFPPDADRLLAALALYRDGLVVGCECPFAWYWLADLCAAENVPFVPGHALYLKAIHGGKTKTDVIDAQKLARLLRGGTFAEAYVYPQAMRATRDLLRRRSRSVGCSASAAPPRGSAAARRRGPRRGGAAASAASSPSAARTAVCNVRVVHQCQGLPLGVEPAEDLGHPCPA